MALSSPCCLGTHTVCTPCSFRVSAVHLDHIPSAQRLSSRISLKFASAASQDSVPWKVVHLARYSRLAVIFSHSSEDAIPHFGGFFCPIAMSSVSLIVTFEDKRVIAFPLGF